MFTCNILLLYYDSKSLIEVHSNLKCQPFGLKSTVALIQELGTTHRGGVISQRDSPG
jgi:hypothetical protein